MDGQKNKVTKVTCCVPIPDVITINMNLFGCLYV